MLPYNSLQTGRLALPALADEAEPAPAWQPGLASSHRQQS